MKFLILGEGAEESAWAETIRRMSGQEVVATWPNNDTDSAPGSAPRDLDEALAWPGVDAVVVGGPISFRDEALRKTASVGLNAIALHPPGPNADAYYQVALSKQETGSIVVPNMPKRFDPGMSEIRLALSGDKAGRPLELLVDVTVPEGDEDLVLYVFSQWADVVRSIVGEITTISAFGEPAGEHPTRRLTAQLRAGDDKRAEVRIGRGPVAAARLVLSGPGGSWSWEQSESCDIWDPRELMLRVFSDAVADQDVHPSLIDGTRAMELAEGVGRSLKRGRTVDLHYERISEENNFKSVMTSLGCMILLGIMVALPLALAGPALGLDWLLYIAYGIPPVLIAFGLLQLLKFGVKKPVDD